MDDKYNNQVVLQLNQPNRNGRTYSTDSVQQAITDLHDRTLFCTYGMPSSSHVPLDRVVGLVSNMRIEGEQLLCNIKPFGPLATMLDELSEHTTFRTAGIGHIDAHGNVTDYQFISISVVNKDTAA